MTPLLAAFLDEECNDYVRGVLQGALVEPLLVRKRIGFNRYLITIDRSRDAVLIEDDLNPGVESWIPLEEFRAAIEASAT